MTRPACTAGRRYYDPATGRFVTRDPIGYGGGTNLYGYLRRPSDGLGRSTRDSDIPHPT